MINVFHPWFNCMILRVPQKLGGKSKRARSEPRSDPVAQETWREVIELEDDGARGH